MTIINQTHKFIFVHIPKNAGTTVTNVLSPYTHWRDIELGGTGFGETVAPAYANRFGIGKHARAAAIRNVIGQPTWDSYYKFAFVRNPYRRSLSTYQFLKKWRNWPGNEIMDQFDTFESFATSSFFQENSGPDNMFMPQARWVSDPEGETILNDVYKLEDIGNSLKTIAAKIPLPNVKTDNDIPKMNRSGQLDASRLILSPAAIDAIQKRYKRDFTKFSYKIDIIPET